MKTKLAAFSIAAALAVSAAVPAFAAPGDKGQGLGGCVDTLYGNATNPRPSGHGVLPSLSPGPFLNNTEANELPRDGSEAGPSMGDVMQAMTAAGLTGADLEEVACPL